MKISSNFAVVLCVLMLFSCGQKEVILTEGSIDNVKKPFYTDDIIQAFINKFPKTSDFKEKNYPAPVSYEFNFKGAKTNKTYFSASVEYYLNAISFYNDSTGELIFQHLPSHYKISYQIDSTVDLQIIPSELNTLLLYHREKNPDYPEIYSSHTMMFSFQEKIQDKPAAYGALTQYNIGYDFENINNDLTIKLAESTRAFDEKDDLNFLRENIFHSSEDIVVEFNEFMDL